MRSRLLHHPGLLLLLALLIGATSTMTRPVRAQSSTSALSPLDYIQIQQLVRQYAWALDSGDSYGYAYADLFTPDGIFVGTNQGPNGRSYQGRDALAALARGGTRSGTLQSHFAMNHVITPTATGATGKVYVVMLDIGVTGMPNQVNHGGFYDDVYVRTPVGWRFKQRSYYESKLGESTRDVGAGFSRPGDAK